MSSKPGTQPATPRPVTAVTSTGAEPELLRHPAVQRVAAALQAAGISAAPVALSASARTAAEAAAALGIAVGQIASSLVFAADDVPVLVLASGAHRVDTDKVAALVGAAAVRRASPDLVRSATGFAIGGVAPVGHPQPLRTLVDHTLARYDVLWAAAGHPRVVFPTTFDELVRMTGGALADVGQG